MAGLPAWRVNVIILFVCFCRDKRLFCFLRCFESFNSAFVLLGLGISF